MTKEILTVWDKVPVPLQRWLKGAEIAVVTGVIAALVTAPAADFSSKAGITKFAASVMAVAAGCMRLYMAQSPLQNVVKEVIASKSITSGGVTLKESVSETTSGPAKA